MPVGKNYTGKIHSTYSVSSVSDNVGRADCSQNVVVNSIDVSEIERADETQFCGKCFNGKRFGSRKSHAIHCASI